MLPFLVALGVCFAVLLFAVAIALRPIPEGMQRAAQPSTPGSRNVNLNAPPQASGKIYRGSSDYEPTAEDETFTAGFETALGDDLVDGFYCKIAGTTFPNADGSDRMQIARGCEPGELLTLAPEPENPYDPNAIAVWRKDGRQLGYLPREQAEEIAGRMRRHAEVWHAVFRRVGRDPSTHGARGAVVLLLHVKGASAAAEPCLAELAQ
jgi:hypothetical protein